MGQLIHKVWRGRPRRRGRDKSNALSRTRPSEEILPNPTTAVGASKRLFKERAIYEPSAARTVREHREKRPCD
jgi:hypothetical protein